MGSEEDTQFALLVMVVAGGMNGGRPPMAKIVRLKKARPQQVRARRDLVPIDKRSGPGRFYAKLIADVESDLAGRSNLSRIESELIRAFAGCCTSLQYINSQICLGEFAGEIDFAAYATLASTMLRIGSRLGLQRRTKDITATLDDYLDAQQQQVADDPVEDSEEVIS